MKHLRWCWLAGLLALAGCASVAPSGEHAGGSSCWLVIFFDWFFGDGSSLVAPFQILGMGLDIIIPGATGLLGLAGTAWASARGKKWKRAFVETAQVIETASEQGISAKDMKPYLADAHSIAGVLKLVAPVVEKIQPDEVTP